MRGKGGFRDEIPRSIPASRPDPLPALLTACGQSKEEPVPWIPEGKGGIPLQWLQINGEKGELTFVQFTLPSEDGTEETWKYTPAEGCVQTEAKHWGETSRLTLTTIQPLIQKLRETMPEDHLNGDEYNLSFQINHALVRPDVGGHPIDLVYSLSSGEITELNGEEYTGSADSGILSLMARLGMESQWRWLVIDN
ncbi:MAG: hypothetical protein PT965_05530 [Clostridia bacterium]|nr:hypothetical protein [Clostridia bacterium]MDY2929366.1 hypothetical protein [Clostridiaceae bacterium]